MKLIDKIKIALVLSSAATQIEKLQKENVSPVKYLPIITTVVGTVASALAFPSFVEHHAVAYAVVNAVAQLLHSALPSVFKA